MRHYLKIVFCWMFIVSGCAAPGLNKDKIVRDPVSKSYSVELQLLDIYLGMPYEKAKALLTQKYGKPIRFESTPHIAITFKLDSKTNNIIKILAKSDDPSAVGSVAVLGTEPITGLNFFSNINLGEPEENIRLKFPKAEVEQKNGYRRYFMPFANYLLDVENGKVTTLGIWNRFTFPVKAGDDSIDLSTNLAIIAEGKGLLTEKGLLSKPENMAKIKALVSDPLRPYCKERYPLRSAFTGKSYIDVNVFKNKQELPIPATFVLDTGWLITSISSELCKKINCKYAKSPASKRAWKNSTKRDISIGGIEFGNTRETTGLFTLMPSEVLRFSAIDGVFGASTLFAYPLFINFKQGYLCFPTLPVSQVAQKLKFAILGPEQETKWFWTNYYVNNQQLKNGLLDSGSDTTFLSKEDIVRLKLMKLNRRGRYGDKNGTSNCPLFGPVEIGWPSLGITQKLQYIAESDDSVYPSLIGIDFLRHYILSIEHETNTVYIGE